MIDALTLDGMGLRYQPKNGPNGSFLLPYAILSYLIEKEEKDEREKERWKEKQREREREGEREREKETKRQRKIGR
ncbi:hypothetical protein FHG87_012682 [Trinorchestia longiramus]|nr:hypothetical protein FHG87_012682 [Trinorchestia longiramus]